MMGPWPGHHREEKPGQGGKFCKDGAGIRQTAPRSTHTRVHALMYTHARTHTEACFPNSLVRDLPSKMG